MTLARPKRNAADAADAGAGRPTRAKEDANNVGDVGTGRQVFERRGH